MGRTADVCKIWVFGNPVGKDFFDFYGYISDMK
jgi:hypothetical protein